MKQEYIVGDVVEYDKKIMAIRELENIKCVGLSLPKEKIVRCYAPIWQLKPVPLTPKILENNGWKLYEPSTKMYIKSNSNLAVCFPPHSDKVQVYYVVEHLRTIKYVHEFQHILWALGMDADLKIPEKSDGKDAKP